MIELRAYSETVFPPFGKGGQGGFAVAALENPPKSPFSKGGLCAVHCSRIRTKDLS
jgi:hypothetical protein